MLKNAVLHYKTKLNNKREITVSLIHGLPVTKIEHIDLIFRIAEFNIFLVFINLRNNREILNIIIILR